MRTFSVKKIVLSKTSFAFINEERISTLNGGINIFYYRKKEMRIVNRKRNLLYRVI